MDHFSFTIDGMEYYGHITAACTVETPVIAGDLVAFCPSCKLVFSHMGHEIGDITCPSCRDHGHVQVLEVRRNNNIPPATTKMTSHTGSPTVDPKLGESNPLTGDLYLL